MKRRAHKNIDDLYRRRHRARAAGTGSTMRFIANILVVAVLASLLAQALHLCPSAGLCLGLVSGMFAGHTGYPLRLLRGR